MKVWNFQLIGEVKSENLLVHWLHTTFKLTNNMKESIFSEIHYSKSQINIYEIQYLLKINQIIFANWRILEITVCEKWEWHNCHILCWMQRCIVCNYFKSSFSWWTIILQFHTQFRSFYSVWDCRILSWKCDIWACWNKKKKSIFFFNYSNSSTTNFSCCDLLRNISSFQSLLLEIFFGLVRWVRKQNALEYKFYKNVEF